MTEKTDTKDETGVETGGATSRRRFLSGSLAAGGAAMAAGLAAAKPAAAEGESVITEVQDWNRYLGDGVVSQPYGVPSRFEANVVRRDVEWLTASRESSVSFTPLHEACASSAITAAPRRSSRRSTA